MFRKLIVFFLAVFMWHCVSTPIASAQNSNSCLKTTTWWMGDAIPPGWFFFSNYPGTFVYVIAAHSALCSAGASGSPPCKSCCGGSAGGPSPAGSSGTGGAAGGPAGGSAGGSGDGASGNPPSAPPSSPSPPCGKAGQPIDLESGNTYILGRDISIPGLGGGLNLWRRWNSVWPSNEIASSIGIFGANWKSTYEERIFMDSDNYVKYARNNGSYWSFGVNDSGALVVASPALVAATLSQNSTSWVLQFLNGEQRQFSLATGMLTAIIDRNGNTIQISYDSSNRLSTVTDPASRHIYFDYTGSSTLVSSVTTDFGMTFSYTYDTNGRLTQVTEPDLTTINYTYNSQSQITQVTDTNGKVFESHTYDSSGRGLTSSQASGANAVTITYP
jgi:YD repeat-containing protein